MAQDRNAQNAQTFQQRVGRIQSGKAMRPDGVLVSEREVQMAVAKTKPPKSKKDVVLIPLALGLGIVCVVMGGLLGPMISELLLQRWPDAEALLQALPAKVVVPVIFGLFACILFNLSTGKRQMAFATGAGAAYFGNGAMIADFGTQAPMLAALL
ncbi:hypothetical protein [Algirhabdus cladophorae]|uniref:hypothetical protein n=1 Tax=Algirhabdus cladophorae TaxID=3377108 RepID=UPI003B84B71C